MLPHTECTALPEIKAVRSYKVFCAHAGFNYVFPRKAEAICPAGVHLAVQHSKPLSAAEGFTGYAKPLEIADDVSLYALKSWSCGCNAFSGYAKGDVLCSFNTVVASGNLVFQHGGELITDAVKGIVPFWDIHPVFAAVSRAAVYKGKLKGQGAVKIVKE